METTPVDTAAAASVSAAIDSRRSVRAFLDTPVPIETVREMVQRAGRAPSGTNTQPWHTHILGGASLQRVIDAVQQAYDSQAPFEEEVAYYPEQWFEPYIGRRRKVGWDLYGLLEITKGDKAKMAAQHRRNYQFFDAPVGLMVTVNRAMNTGSWLDTGMYLQNLMLLAREQGLHSCPQAAWCGYHKAVRAALPLADEEVLVCALALGHADPEAIENTLRSDRAALADSCTEHA